MDYDTRWRRDREKSRKGRKWRKSEEQGVEEDRERKWKGEAWECKREERSCLRIVVWNRFLVLIMSIVSKGVVFCRIFYLRLWKMYFCIFFFHYFVSLFISFLIKKDTRNFSELNFYIISNIPKIYRKDWTKINCFKFSWDSIPLKKKRE